MTGEMYRQTSSWSGVTSTRIPCGPIVTSVLPLGCNHKQSVRQDPYGSRHRNGSIARNITGRVKRIDGAKKKTEELRQAIGGLHSPVAGSRRYGCSRTSLAFLPTGRAARLVRLARTACPLLWRKHRGPPHCNPTPVRQGLKNSQFDFPSE